MLIAGSVGLCVVAIVAGTGPVLYMTHHSFRHGHVADRPRDPARAAAQEHGWTVCPECSAVVTDAEVHLVAAHQVVHA